MNHLQCTVCGQWLTSLIWNVLPYRYLFLMYCSVLSVVLVVGVAKHIDWFGPSGDRIEPNRQDTTVTRNDESTSTLTLYKAGTESAGTYKCVATNGDQQAESTVKVKIFRKFPPTAPPHSIRYTLQITEWCEHRRKRILLIELIVFYWLLKGNTLFFLFKWGWIFHQFNKRSEDH